MLPSWTPGTLQGAAGAARSPLMHSSHAAPATVLARRRGRHPRVQAAQQPQAGPPRRRRPSSLPPNLIVRREPTPTPQHAGSPAGQTQQPQQQAPKQQQGVTAAPVEIAPGQAAAQLRPWQQAASSVAATGDGAVLAAQQQGLTWQQPQPMQWPVAQQQQPQMPQQLLGQAQTQQQPVSQTMQPWLAPQQAQKQQAAPTSQWQGMAVLPGSQQQPAAAAPSSWHEYTPSQHQQQHQQAFTEGLKPQEALQAGLQQQPWTLPHQQDTQHQPWQQAAGGSGWAAAAGSRANAGIPGEVGGHLHHPSRPQPQQQLQSLDSAGWPLMQGLQQQASPPEANQTIAAPQLAGPTLQASRQQQQQPAQAGIVVRPDVSGGHHGSSSGGGSGGTWQPISSMSQAATDSAGGAVSSTQLSSGSSIGADEHVHDSARSENWVGEGSALCAAQLGDLEQLEQQPQLQHIQPLQQQEQEEQGAAAGSPGQKVKPLQAAPTAAGGGLSSRRTQRSLARAERATASQPPAADTPSPPAAATATATVGITAVTPEAAGSGYGEATATGSGVAGGAVDQAGSSSMGTVATGPTTSSSHNGRSPTPDRAETPAASTASKAAAAPSRGSSSSSTTGSKTDDVKQSLKLITAIGRAQRAAAKAASVSSSPLGPAPGSGAGSIGSSRKAAAAKTLTVSLSAGGGKKKPVSSSGGSSGSSVAGSSGSSVAGSNGAAGDVVQVGPGTWKLVGYTQDLQDWKQLTPVLQERLRAAIQAEQVHEAAALRALYSAGNLSRLQQQGLVLVGLAAAPHSLLFSSMVWELRPGRGELGYHRFRPGDSVLLSRWTGQSQAAPVKVEASAARDATVLEVSKGRLTVALDKADSDTLVEQLAAGGASSNAWRLDQSVRDTTARRQLEAVSKLDTLAEPSSPFETLLCCALVGSRSAAAVAQMPPSWVRDPAWREDVRRLLGQQQGLNNSQRRAVARALLGSLTLWQGPPGTGKTRTLLALIRVLAEATAADGERWRRVGPILACGDTNAAVDNIVEGLAASGLSVVRLGAAAKVRASVRHLALEALAADTAPGRRAAQLRESSRVLFERARSLTAGELPSAAPAATTQVPLVTGSRSSTSRATTARLARSSSSSASSGSGYGARETASEVEARAKREWRQAEALSKEAAGEVLAGAQVVVATCSGAGDPAIANRIFRMVVIDEASQATEPAVLVPLVKGAQCVVMAGDPRQLPPTILSREAVTAHGLDVTLFERLVGRGLEPLLLDTQYRMHPAISAWPSQWFYQGKLQDGVTAQQKPPAAGFPWPSAGVVSPVALVQVAGREERSSRNNRQRGSGSSSDSEADQAGGGGGGAPAPEEASYRNLEEARVALAAMYALLTAGDAETGAILTPYRGQARALEHGLRTLGPWWEALAGRVTVSSVDAFQGREADVVVLSTVRCNPRGAVGFVADPRRLNVAITRPRRGLVVVGSPATLAAGSPDWKGYITWLQQHGAVMPLERVPQAPWEVDGRDAFELAPVLDSV